MHKLAIIPGDGIGPEVIDVALDVLDLLKSKCSLAYETKTFPFGAGHFLQTGQTLTDDDMAALKPYDAIFLGAVGDPKVKPGILEKGILLKLRFDFEQYINLRPVKLYPGVYCPLKNKTEKDIDYIVVRENTGGLYTGVGSQENKGTNDEVAIQSMVYSYKQVERCLRYAFELTRTRSRKTLALIGKSNVLTLVFDLWLRVYEDLAKEFSDVKTEYYHVDAACMHMVNTPERFDVMVTTNMFGDIITDLGAMTQGGMGMAASGNLNPTKQFPSMFEPVHGSAPDIVGQNKANPMAAVMSLKMMLDFLGEKEAAAVLDRVIAKTSQKGIDGRSTSEVAALLKDFLKGE